MKLKLLLFFILILPYSYAYIDNYNNYESLDIILNISSFANPIVTGSGARLELVNATLRFYPRNDGLQSIARESQSAIPQANIIKGNGYISFIWSKPEFMPYKFESNYEVNVRNEIVKVGEKISFPQQGFDDNIKIYTRPSNFIDVNDDIKTKAAEITNGERDYYAAVFKLASWVNENINYSADSMTSEAIQKSSWVMENKYGVCDELTDLFISMCRSVGIPARFASGVAFSNRNNGFGNHGWAEVYFPGHGWIPFDPTYGQYGWIDPSHVKLYDSKDSESSSVDYMWRAYNMNMQTYGLSISAEAKNGRKSSKKMVEFSTRPLIEGVDFGSYMPMEMKLKNTEDYYVAMTFDIRNLPWVYNDSFSKRVLLKPREEKNVYWILYAPLMHDENYIYSFDVEFADDFNNTARSKIKYAAIYDHYEVEDALKMVKGLEIGEDEEILGDLELSCNAPSSYVYSDADIPVTCNAFNIGSKYMKGVKICLLEKCRTADLAAGENMELTINHTFGEGDSAVVKAEYSGKVKHASVKANIVKKPLVTLKKSEIKSIGYNEKKNIEIEITTNTKISDVTIKFGNNKVNLRELEGRHIINLEATGKMLMKGLKISATYKDKGGKYYFIKDEIKSKVVNVPWYAGLFKF